MLISICFKLHPSGQKNRLIYVSGARKEKYQPFRRKQAFKYFVNEKNFLK